MENDPCFKEPYSAEAQVCSQRNTPSSAPYSFTYDNLFKCLYMRNEARDSRTVENCEKALQKGSSKCTDRRDKKLNNAAVKSCPDELEICPSVTCAFKNGVRTKQMIPEGTWMGPYQGTLVLPSDVTTEVDTSYMWEIYENGKLQHYIDGSDDNTSSWMRYIRCARHKREQNLYVFQYNKEIYYRAFAAISAGEELLVWYEDVYPQYMGIPLNITDIGRCLLLADHNSNCPVHTGSFFGHDSAKQNTRRPNNEESRFLNNTKTDHVFSSVVFSPSTRHSQTRVPNLFPSRSDEYRVQMQGRGLEKAISQRDHYRPPVRRAIVIEKLEDAPDPFSVLIKEK